MILMQISKVSLNIPNFLSDQNVPATNLGDTEETSVLFIDEVTPWSAMVTSYRRAIGRAPVESHPSPCCSEWIALCVCFAEFVIAVLKHTRFFCVKNELNARRKINLCPEFHSFYPMLQVPPSRWLFGCELPLPLAFHPKQISIFKGFCNFQARGCPFCLPSPRMSPSSAFLCCCGFYGSP